MFSCVVFYWLIISTGISLYLSYFLSLMETVLCLIPKELGKKFQLFIIIYQFGIKLIKTTYNICCCIHYGKFSLLVRSSLIAPINKLSFSLNVYWCFIFCFWTKFMHVYLSEKKKEKKKGVYAYGLDVLIYLKGGWPLITSALVYVMLTVSKMEFWSIVFEDDIIRYLTSLTLVLLLFFRWKYI